MSEGTAAGKFDLNSMLANMMGQPGTAPKEWWRGFHYPETVEFDPEKLIGCARSALFAKALLSGQPTHECTRTKSGWRSSGTGPDVDLEIQEDNIEELVKVFDGRLTYSFTMDGRTGKFYTFESGAFYVVYNSHYLKMQCVSLNKTHTDILQKHFNSCYKEKSE